MISKKVFQIYHDKNLVSTKIIDDIKNKNPDYEYYLYDFEEGIQFVRNNFESVLSEKIIIHLNNLESKAHKSDLLRYCLLYIYGGVYIDIDLKQKMTFNEIISLSDNSDLITSFGLYGNIKRMSEEEFKTNNEKYHPAITNGILFSVPKNKILYDQIIFIISCPFSIKYSTFVNYFHNYLYKLNDNNNLIPFVKTNIDNIFIYLFKEITFQKGGKCCFINKLNEIIMYSNNYMDKKDYLNM